MLVHPDKNMGSPLASESFKKLQSAYEVVELLIILNLYILKFLVFWYIDM